MNLPKKAAALFLAVPLLLTMLTGCGGGKKAREMPSETTLPPVTESPERAVRDGVQTVLAISLRPFEQADAAGFRNGSQADMLMLLVIDETRGRTTGLQLNPDTMVSFTAPGTQEPLELPLGEIYSYGSGGSDSCLSQQKAVSKLLGGLKIDHYMILSQDSIGIINDLLGGLEVKLPEALAEQYPEAGEAGAVRLTGQQAIGLFGYREDADVSGQLHMACQQQFMMALYGPFTRSMQDDNFLTKLTMQLGDRLNTDLALSQMVHLMEVMEACQLVDTIVTLPGEARQEDGQYRCRVDPEKVEPILEDLFY